MAVPGAAAASARFAALAEAFRAAGPARLLVLADFDQTLTTYRAADGRPGHMCHDLLLGFATDAPGAQPLREFNDGRMPAAASPRAREAQVRWFFEEFQRVAVAARWAEEVESCVEQGNTRVRPGLREMFGWLKAHDVPLVVVSAGLVQVIGLVLAREDCALPPGSLLLANDLRSETARVTSRTKAQALGASIEDFRALAAGRTHFLVLGDKSRDCDVAEVLDPDAAVLKIGFAPEDADLAEYLETFDAAVEGDASMDTVVDFLSSVSGPAGRRGAL